MELISVLLFSFFLKAEYRAFALIMKNESGETVKKWDSTLDPIQYRDFNPVPNGHTLTYQDTWMCYGSTAHFKNICPNPKAVSESQDPVAQEREPVQD
jgi:hypothetical protein